MIDHELETMLRRYHGIDDDADGVFKGNAKLWEMIKAKATFEEIAQHQVLLGIKNDELLEKERKRKQNDYYPTPARVVEEIMRALMEDGLFPAWFEDGIDPCAGGDAEKNYIMPFPWIIESIQRALDSTSTTEAEAGAHKSFIKTIDIRKDSAAQVRGVDFLTMEPPEKKYDFSHTNYPFSVWTQFFDRLRKDFITDRGVIGSLGRIDIMSSKGRLEWINANRPNYAYVLSERPSFTGSGTDWYNYAYYVWEMDKFNPKWTMTRTI